MSYHFEEMNSYGNHHMNEIHQFNGNYGSNQNQVEDQCFIEDYQCYDGNDQSFYGQSYEEQPNYCGNFQEQQRFNDFPYNDGGYNNEGLMSQQSQECLYYNGNDNGDEQQNFYKEEHHYNPNLDYNECFYDNNSHFEEFPIEPRQEDKDLMFSICKELEAINQRHREDMLEIKSSLARMDVELQRRSEEMNSSKEEVYGLYEDKSLESSFGILTQSTQGLNYEDDDDLKDEVSDHVKEELHEGEDFEEDVEDIEKSCEDENVGFIWELDDLFDYEDSTLHDEILYEDIEGPCDEDIDESSEDENVGFIWPIDELFEYENRTLFEDVTLEDDLFESWISHKQGEDLIFNYGAMEPLHKLEVTKKYPSYANGELRGLRPQILVNMDWSRERRPQILLLVGFRPRLNRRKFKWDLKVD